jgi:hypothetical protein
MALEVVDNDPERRFRAFNEFDVRPTLLVTAK